ncbi:hypothetical protein HJC23_006095 [Cyclotella cryptica]|uniref:gamma-glutamylcyclotransferase n=1 Tax=Cyclotella cryptica TaxID=29204 RepID=A0ABD3QJG7_9STRA
MPSPLHRLLLVLLLYTTTTTITTTTKLSCHALSSQPAVQQPPRTYHYFAFGSNMCTSTMTNLRNLSPLASTAAVLPCHELRFNIPGIVGIEPSSASVEPVEVTIASDNGRGEDDWIEEMVTNDQVVHGTLYTLDERDFATICQTEGVPFVYSLHRCRVIPYVGDGRRAGITSLKQVLWETLSMDAKGADGNKNSHSTTTTTTTKRITNSILQTHNRGIPAFTLRATHKQWRTMPDIPPSQSYLNVLLRGAMEYHLDEAYVTKLRNVKVGKTWVGDGLAEEMLRWAERRK